MSDAVHITDYARPRFPLPLRLVNASRPLLRALVSLEPDALIEAAQRKTGLSDFGPDSWREPFHVLVDAIRREADLSGMGLVATRGLLVGLLANRLLLEDLLRREPEILDEAIERPLIIAGLPRTGTTHLHNLISADPGSVGPPKNSIMRGRPPAASPPPAHRRTLRAPAATGKSQGAASGPC